jgi:transcriptional regulator with XRE-family HTH domain
MYKCKKFTMSIGDRLSKFRKNSGKTQQEIADELGVERRTYASWESGKTELKNSLVPKIAELFNIEIPELFNDEKNIEIKDSFNENKNAVIVIITEKEIVEKVLNILGKD